MKGREYKKMKKIAYGVKVTEEKQKPSPSPDELFEMLDLMIDLDECWYLDSAQNYGLSETYLQKWVATKSDQELKGIAIGSKIYRVDPETKKQRTLTSDVIYEGGKKSIQKLGLQKLDTFWLHDPDPEFLLAGTLEGFSRLCDDGLIDSHGICNATTTDYLEQIVECWEKNHLRRPTCLQQTVNLMMSTEDQKVIQMAHQNDIQVFAIGPRQKGLLSGKYEFNSDRNGCSTVELLDK
ncbi:MAG: aldo/keto reductase [Bdellovibrionota bacterium]